MTSLRMSLRPGRCLQGYLKHKESPDKESKERIEDRKNELRARGGRLAVCLAMPMGELPLQRHWSSSVLSWCRRHGTGQLQEPAQLGIIACLSACLSQVDLAQELFGRLRGMYPASGYCPGNVPHHKYRIEFTIGEHEASSSGSLAANLHVIGYRLRHHASAW